MDKWTVAVLAVAMSVQASGAEPAPGEKDWLGQHRDWQAQRLARLTAPEAWLSLVGLHWLSEGRYTLGRGEGVDIDLRQGPERLGELAHGAEGWTLTLVDPAVASVDGQSVAQTQLKSDQPGPATLVRYGTGNFILIERDGRHALRVRDSAAETRTAFAGIESFEPSLDWRIEARFEAYAEPRQIEVATVVGTLEAYANPGRAVFTVEGREYSLDALLEPGATDYFFIVGDRTNGKESYGMARYLYAAPPADGKIVLDFNRLYNPPCAFTAFATCPMPPPQNRLDLAIRAGEKKYLGPGH